MEGSRSSSISQNMSLRTGELFKLIPMYDGDEISLNKFINACTIANNIADEFQKPLLLIHIKNSLKGSASYLINSRDLVDWDEVAQCLINNFGDSRDSVSLIHDLQTFTQKYNETSLQFCSRINAHNAKIRNRILLDKTLSCGEKNAQIDLCDKISLKTVLTGLNKDIGVIIRARNPKDLAEAVSYIQNEEQLIYLENSRKRQNIRTNHPKSNFNKSNYNNYSNKNNPNQRSNSYYQNNPQANKFKNSERQNFNNSRPQNSNNKFCKFCKKVGHEIEYCYKKKNLEKENKNVSNLNCQNELDEGNLSQNL